MASAGLRAQRRWYAEELRWNAKLQSKRLVDAFATVPREAFLGRGPWHILGDRAVPRGYETTANPGDLYHNVLVAIDPRRSLNNGLPSFLACLIQLLEIRKGDIVYHVGCGTGYYSAIMAEMTGRSGRVVALEVDKALARNARRNLGSYPQVEVLGADGFAHESSRRRETEPTGAPASSGTWVSIPAWAAGPRPLRRSWARHSPAATQKRCARCGATSMRAAGIAGFTAGIFACREGAPSRQ